MQEPHWPELLELLELGPEPLGLLQRAHWNAAGRVLFQHLIVLVRQKTFDLAVLELREIETEVHYDCWPKLVNVQI